MFASGKQVVNILFNGYNTNKLNWFISSNVISSSWTDFPSGVRQRCGTGCFVSVKGDDRYPMLSIKGTHTAYFSSFFYIINQKPMIPRTDVHCITIWVSRFSG